MKKELAVISTVQPKPTRAEIIDALTQLEVQRRNEASKADVAKRKALTAEIETELAAHFKKVADKAAGSVRWNVYAKSNWANISFDIPNIPKSTQAKMIIADKLPTMAREYQFCKVRKEILDASAGFDKTTRVSRLLEGEDSRKSLEKILDTLKK